METLRRNLREIDFTMLGVLVLLGVYSCVALTAATYGKNNPNIPSHSLMKQLLFESIGWIAMLFMMTYDYRNLRRWRWWLFGGNLLMLVATFAMPAHEGAHSWIPLGPFTFQPSEFAKLTMLFVMGGFMADIDEAEFSDYRLKKLWPLFVMFVIPFLLTLKEPALGQALVLFTIFVTVYAIFSRRLHSILIFSVVLVIVVGMSVAAGLFPQETTNFVQNVLVNKHHLLKGFQGDRILAWLNPKYDPQGAGYNIRMTQTAIGSGQVFGEGYLNGVLSAWIPNQWTDYIFSAIGEEFGFVGGSLLVLLFLILTYRIVRIAQVAQDTFGVYVAVGIASMFAFQVFENVGMDMYLSPSTGITLPFISYGGSSLIANFMAVGIVLSIGLRRRKLRFA